MLVQNYLCFAYEIAQSSSQPARHSSLTEQAWQQYGIPEPVREIGNGSLC
jgi:hypothetical protein